MLNRIDLQGRFTTEPELKHTPNGKTVISFTLAHQRSRKEDGTIFVDCVAWERTATFISQYFRRGQEAIVTGELECRGFVDRNGAQRRVWEIRVDQIHFCGGKREKGENDGEEPEAGERGYEEYEDKGELPF